MSAVAGASTDRGQAPPATTGRAVLLATLDVPFAREAIEFAIESALEARSPLLVVDAVPLRVGYPASGRSRTAGDVQVREQQELVVREALERGAEARSLYFNHPRPLTALVNVAAERDVGLIVFGPDRAIYGRFRFRRAARRLRSQAGRLVWPFD